MSSYRVHVTKDYLGFASGHFISYEGHECERLHGHNYRVGVTVEGPLGPSRYVMNFVTIKRAMKRLADELDHRVLLATRNPVIRVREDGDVVEASCRGKRYLLPRDDVVLLPIENTTAELLARHLLERFRNELESLGGAALTSLEVEVEESPGQSAFCRETLGAGTADRT
ncbi:MAG TPA: 6-carboxytetrahydropterin synthase [Gemmatimonadota bacterium]|jgi:6-pyruvoyltetrahydropterin/6-carboxytetrahydropterin synthase